ncbi:hypothetical protein DKX38_003745 [Salix brachista]|uniref:Uncharacterized protein n=1 Tax=Salix brachista TaxID=2182728 RepID=A0A5N5NB57_9ROSI|nr:hypothetical protein DKX38_003745 [Salix brachista]
MPKKLSKTDTKKLTETEKLTETDSKKLTETHIRFTKNLTITDIGHIIPFPTQSLEAFAIPKGEHSKEIGATDTPTQNQSCLQAGQSSPKKGVPKKKMKSPSS